MYHGQTNNPSLYPSSSSSHTMATQPRILAAPHPPPASPGHGNSKRKKRPWQQQQQRRRMHSLRAQSRLGHESQEALSREGSRSSAEGASAPAQKWWSLRLGRGLINDLGRRAPFYGSDWKDAWDYRVVPATVYMYFAKYGLCGSRI